MINMHIALLLVAVAVAAATTVDAATADAATTYPNIGHAFYGYNIYYGNPMGDRQTTRDPGFTTPLFVADYSENKLSADRRFKIPNGMNTGIHEECSTSFKAQAIRNSHEYKTNLEKSVKVTAGYGGGTCSASTGYKEAQTELDSNNKVYEFATAKCLYYFTAINFHYKIPPISEAFSQALTRLQTATAQQDFFEFFDRFGTHFVKKMIFGARFTYIYRLDEITYMKLKSESTTVDMQAEYAGMSMTVGAHLALSESQESSVNKFISATTKTTVTVGARPSADGNVLTWAATSVPDNPVPAQYTLAGIEELLTHQLNYRRVRQKMVQYKAQYCQHLKQTNKLKSCVISRPPAPVDECSLGTHQCHVQANCSNEVVGYRCECKLGFEGDGFDCISPYPVNTWVRLRNAGLDQCVKAYVQTNKLFTWRHFLPHTCNRDEAAQQWKIKPVEGGEYVKIISRGIHGFCLWSTTNNFIGSILDNGSRFAIASCSNENYQQHWRIEDKGSNGVWLRGRVSDECAAMRSSTRRPPLFLWNCNTGDNNQLWHIEQ